MTEVVKYDRCNLRVMEWQRGRVISFGLHEVRYQNETPISHSQESVIGEFRTVDELREFLIRTLHSTYQMHPLKGGLKPRE